MDYGFRQNGMKKMKYIDKIKLDPNKQLLQLIQPMGQADKSMGDTDARMHEKPLQDKLSRHPHILSLESIFGKATKPFRTYIAYLFHFQSENMKFKTMKNNS